MLRCRVPRIPERTRVIWERSKTKVSRSNSEATLLALQIGTWLSFGNLAHNTNKIKKISDALKAYNDAVNEYYNQEIESLWDKDNPNLNRVMTKYEEGQSFLQSTG